MSVFPGLAVELGLGLVLLAGFILFRRRGEPFAEAVTLTVVTLMAILSFELQLFFLVGRPALSLAVEVPLVAAAVATLLRERRTLAVAWCRLWTFVRGRPVLASLLGVAWTYLFALVWWIPPGNPDALRYHLARVLLFQQERTLFLDVTALHQAHRAVFPIGSDVLSHLWLRFHSDYGVATFSFLSYLAIAFGTYALARRYAAPAASMATSTVVLSLSGLVYQATAAKNDIVMAAAGLYCAVLVHRLLERTRASDLVLVILGLSFGLSVKTLFLGFAGPFVLVFGVLLAHRWPRAAWRRILRRYRWEFAAVLVPAVILSQLWLFTHNYRTTGGWQGPPGFMAANSNRDGLRGAAVNLVRYVHQVPDFLKVGDRIAYHLCGRPLSTMVQRVYDGVFAPVFQGLGTPSRFRVSWSMNESESWFGPLGFLVVFPAAVWSLWRGPAALRGIALVLLAYVFLVAWQVAWTPWNGRFFTLCFACSGGFVACWLRRWHRAVRPLEIVAVVLLFVACGFNETKPLFPLVARADLFLHGLLWDNVGAKTDWGRERYYFYGDVRGLETFARIVAPRARVGIMANDVASFYHYMMRRPDVEYILLPREPPTENLDYLLCIGLEECDQLGSTWGNGRRTCHVVDGRWSDYCLVAGSLTGG